MIMRTLLFALIAGCATKAPQVLNEPTAVISKAICKRPAISNSHGQSWLLEDENMIPSFEKGCIKFYSPAHCPVRVLKSGKLSYQVTCKRDH